MPALHVAAAPAGGHCEVVVYTPERTTSRGALALGHIELLLEVPRSLVASGFNQRRRECEEACRLLGVQSLRDVRRIEQVEALPEPWRQRARHVVQENARVLLAVASADAETLGALMNASHASLRDEYDVSTPELDQLVSLLQEHPAVFGAKLTGAGFGGACVAICAKSRIADVATAVLGDYRRLGNRGRLLAPPALPAQPRRRHRARRRRRALRPARPRASSAVA